MRGLVLTLCGAVCAGLASAQDAEDRLEFSGLTSPCDEAAEAQAVECARLDDVNEDLEVQIASLQARVDAELVTYGDTTNSCLSTCVQPLT